MEVEPTRYSGWNDYPTCKCRTYNTYSTIGKWCYDNNVETFLLSSGNGEYTFQVKSNHAWFVLRWL